MKRIISLLLVVVFVLAFSSVAFALSEDAANGLGTSPAFEEGDMDEQYIHEKGNLIFGLPRDAIAIPSSQAGENSEFVEEREADWSLLFLPKPCDE